MSRIHNPSTKNRAIKLYFEIEKHFAFGGEALGLEDVRKMVGLKSKSTTKVYIDMLKEWGLLSHRNGFVRAITLVRKKNYPLVVWRKDPRKIGEHEHVED